MDVVHAVDDDATDLLESLVGSHGGYGVALNEDVAFGEELDCLLSVSADYIAWLDMVRPFPPPRSTWKT